MGREKGPAANAARGAIRLPRWRKAVFAVLTVAGFFLLLEQALWLAGVEPLRDREDPFAGFSSRIPHFEVEVEDGVDVVRTAGNKQKHLNPQEFLAEKPEGTVRIFCIGGSSTYGRPFFDETSFPGLLRAMLPAADPSRRYEVINAGGISYASYRVLGVTREIVKYDPDLVVVYCGHNEFLELKTYRDVLQTPAVVTETAAWLTRWRTYTVLRDTLAAAGLSPPRSDHTAADALPSEPEFAPVLTVGPDAYTREEGLRGRVIAQFESNLRRIVTTAREAGAEVILVTPGANLRFGPFKSAHREDLDETGRARFNFYFRGAMAQVGKGRFEAALADFEEAARIDSRRADVHFATAETLMELGRVEEARARYLRALEEDVVPLRAGEGIRLAVRHVAEESGAPLVDLPRLLAERSESGVPGEGFFYDHVHLTVPTNRITALAVLQAMGLGGGRADEMDRAAEDHLARVDPRKQARELTALAGLLKWLGRSGLALLRVREAELLDPENLEALKLEGNMVLEGQRPEEAVEIFERVLEKEPELAEARCLLGIALDESGREAEALGELRHSVQASETPLAWERIGLILSRRNRHEEAVEAFGEVVRLSPESAAALCNLGLALARIGRETLAMQRYREALEKDPELPTAHYNLGQLLERLGRTPEAVRSYRLTVKYAPEHAGARDRLREIERPSFGVK